MCFRYRVKVFECFFPCDSFPFVLFAPYLLYIVIISWFVGHRICIGSILIVDGNKIKRSNNWNALPFHYRSGKYNNSLRKMKLAAWFLTLLKSKLKWQKSRGEEKQQQQRKKKTRSSTTSNTVKKELNRFFRCLLIGIFVVVFELVWESHSLYFWLW